MKRLKTFLPEIIAILLAFFIGSIILIITGYNPLLAFYALFKGAFGDKFGIGQTLTQATPILFTSLGFLIAFRAGIFNIGLEGQFLIGAFATALVGIYFKNLPSFIHIPLALFLGGLAGGFWGLIPALLKVYLGTHEVITTMMMSYVAFYFTGYLVNYPLKAPGWVAQTYPIQKSATLIKILPPTQLSLSFIISLIFAYLVYYFLFKTYIGYEIRVVGLNPTAAENRGINIKSRIFLAFVISAFIAGVGGGGEILGVHGRFVEGFSPGYGWDGIAVSLVGRLNPFGCIFASILFGMLRAGGMVMTRVTNVPLDLSLIIQSLVIIFVSAPSFIRYVILRRKDIL